MDGVVARGAGVEGEVVGTEDSGDGGGGDVAVQQRNEAYGAGGGDVHGQRAVGGVGGVAGGGGVEDLQEAARGRAAGAGAGVHAVGARRGRA